MIDTVTKEPLRVLDGGIRPYLELPECQLPEVEELMKKNDIYYWVEEDRYSDDGGPWIATINFKLEADPASIQSVFDKAS